MESQQVAVSRNAGKPVATDGPEAPLAPRDVSHDLPTSASSGPHLRQEAPALVPACARPRGPAAPRRRRALPVHCGPCSPARTCRAYKPRDPPRLTPGRVAPSRGLAVPSGRDVPSESAVFPPGTRDGSRRGAGRGRARARACLRGVDARLTCSSALRPRRASPGVPAAGGCGGGTRRGRREPAAAAAAARKWRRPWRTPGG